jgi:uncharacterized protein (TIGR03437 family)
VRSALFLFAVTHLTAFPVHFEPNQGQVKGRTEWTAQARGASVYITAQEVVFALGNGNAHMKFVGASPKRKGRGADPTGGYSNYFLGTAEKSWFTGIPHYDSLRYSNIYPGIDILYHNHRGDIEYDFLLAPGADPNQIELAFDRDIHIDPGGDLILGGLRQHRPHVTQDGHEISSEYLQTGPGRVRIKLARYGRTRPLTIDPVLDFSTYLGGPGVNAAFAIALDPSGNIYLGGDTQTPATPSLDPFQQPNGSVWQPFVMKLSADGQKVLYFSVFSSGYGTVFGLAVDSSGSVAAVGNTYTTQFPLKNAFEPAPALQYQTGFVLRLTPDGRSFAFSSYLGGSVFDVMQIVRIAPDGSIFVVGNSESPDFPLKNAYQSTLQGATDCTISKVSPQGALVFSTYFGTDGQDGCGGIEIAYDGTLWLAGGTHSPNLTLVNPIQAGSNPGPIYAAPFLAHFSADAKTLLYSTYVGGESFAGGGNLNMDDEGNIYISGAAGNAFLTLKDPYQSTITNGRQGFLMKFDPTGRNLLFSTYTPGSGSVAIDKSHNIYIAGIAFFPDFPQIDSISPFLGGGSDYDQDAFVMKFTSSGKSLIYSTLLSGSKADYALGLAVNDAGDVFVTGGTNSTDFPIKNAFQSKSSGGQDIFLAKISDNTSSQTGSLDVSPALIVFQYVQGSVAPTSQSVAVTGAEQYFVTTNASWLSALPSGSPNPPNNVQISVNAGSRAPGTYTGAVTIHPQSGAQVTTVNVTLTVFGPPAVISSVEPSMVAIGTDDTLITVHGSGFMPGASVYVSGVKWTQSPVNIADAQTITFKMLKENFSGLISYPVTVLNPLSVQSNAVVISVGSLAPVFSAASVVNSASYVPAPVAPGEIVVLFGQNFGSIDTTSVLFDNLPAKILYLTPTQLAATVPATAGNGQTTALQIQTSHDVFSAAVRLPVAPAAPGLFTSDASGSGQAAAVNQDNSVNGNSSPAPAGSVVALYATGGGRLTSDPLPRVSLLVTATIGGLDAQVLYSGIAPGEPDGVIQINVQIPAAIQPGAANILVNIGAISSQPNVTLTIGPRQ